MAIVVEVQKWRNYSLRSYFYHTHRPYKSKVFAGKEIVEWRTA